MIFLTLGHIFTYFDVYMIHTCQKFWNWSSRSPQPAAVTQVQWLQFLATPSLKVTSTTTAEVVIFFGPLNVVRSQKRWRKSDLTAVCLFVLIFIVSYYNTIQYNYVSGMTCVAAQKTNEINSCVSF